MKPVQLAFDFTAAPARKWGRSMLARLAALAVSAAVLVAPAAAQETEEQPEWVSKLVLSPVFIKDSKGALGYTADAKFTVENHGTETTPARIIVRCTFFDAQDNTVAESSQVIGKIKAGRQAIDDMYLSDLDEARPPRTSDCEIRVHVGRPIDFDF